MGAEKKNRAVLPKRIILVRHGESQGNVDIAAYTTTPDIQIPLTPRGIQQARGAGKRINRIVSDDGASSDSKVYFYVSPCERTLSTLREIGRAFHRERIIGVREECRIRPQHCANFQVDERIKALNETRLRYGRFYFSFPEGESGANVFDRISSFMDTLSRDIDQNRLNRDTSSEFNLIIVSHGLTIRIFLTQWFNWNVNQFEQLKNPGSCEVRVMQLGSGGEYSLAINHTEEEMEAWGLGPTMIADQQWRATAHTGDTCPWNLDAFFDHPTDTEDSTSDDDDYEI